MAKPSSDKSTSKLAGELNVYPYKVEVDADLPKNEEVLVDSESKPLYNKPRVVRLRSTIDSRIEYIGQETGKLYIWTKAGSVVEVSENDALYLLEKRMGAKPCCGNSPSGRPIFEQLN